MRVLLILIGCICTQMLGVSVDVQASGTKKMPLLIGFSDNNSDALALAQTLKKDLEFREQLTVTYQTIALPLNKSAMRQLYKDGYQVALLITAQDETSIEYRLYNTFSAQMIVGKKYIKRGSVQREWAHHIADAIWPSLTNQPGIFSTKIAYCQEVPIATGRHYKHIVITDYDGSNPIKLVSSPTISVAPRWNKDANNPLLFYSECTRSNIRLMAMDMKHHRKVVSNFDGLNMLPTFSPDGKKVVYCASRGDGSCQLYYYDKGSFKRLTENNGNNISPTFCTDDSLFFCSDFETGLPQIYRYNFALRSLERITDSGYCASPAYCPARNMLAYTKLVKGFNQLYVYDCTTKQHTQVTFDTTNKEECSWSECGNLLIYSLQSGQSSRIAMLDLATKQQKFLTGPELRCTYPTWSMPFTAFPMLS